EYRPPRPFPASFGRMEFMRRELLMQAAGRAGADWAVLSVQASSYRGLRALEDDGDALAHADAHSAKGVTAFGAEELIERGGDEAGATSTERVADGDGASVGIDVGRVVGNTQVAENRESLRRECLVELDNVHLRERQTCFG